MASASTRTRDDPHQAKVLLVDDDPSTRGALLRILEGHGLAVVAAKSGQEAVILLEGGTFDTVISDVQMPDISGIDLLRAARRLDPDLSFVLISGAPDLESALKAVKLGASEYLTKPLEIEQLTDSVRKATLATRRKREERVTLARVRPRVDDAHVESSPQPGSWTGALLSGKYRIGEKIGSGGMGNVYAATRQDLSGMAVAVKLLHEIPGHEADLQRRFRREAETIARLNHPNIVKVWDFVVPEVGPAFLVMERLEGQPLSALIRQEAPLEPTRVVFVATQILAALTAAHEGQVIHRDLKPDNVFLTSFPGVRDIVRVLDFGVAKLIEVEADQNLTQDGALVGTPAYMSPEQARGEAIDGRSDLYSVAAMMYECLTGLPPLRASNPHALLTQIQMTTPDPLGALRPELDAELVLVIERALAKHPEQRFSSAREMIAALEPWMTGTSSVVSPANERDVQEDLVRLYRTTLREPPPPRAR